MIRYQEMNWNYSLLTRATREAIEKYNLVNRFYSLNAIALPYDQLLEEVWRGRRECIGESSPKASLEITGPRLIVVNIGENTRRIVEEPPHIIIENRITPFNIARYFQDLRYVAGELHERYGIVHNLDQDYDLLTNTFIMPGYWFKTFRNPQNKIQFN